MQGLTGGSKEFGGIADEKKLKIKSKQIFKESCLPKWMRLKSFEIRLIAKELLHQLEE